MKPLRFEFRVLNAEGDEIASDWTILTPDTIDQFGNCETVDIHVGSTLRFVRRQHMAGKLERETA